MKLFVRIARQHHIKTRHDTSEWLWHFIGWWWEVPIENAAIYGNFDIVCYLHENGADIHARDEYALRCASKYGYFDIVRYLHNNGADVHYAMSYSLQNEYHTSYYNLKTYLESYEKNKKCAN